MTKYDQTVFMRWDVYRLKGHEIFSGWSMDGSHREQEFWGETFFLYLFGSLFSLKHLETPWPPLETLSFCFSEIWNPFRFWPFCSSKLHRWLFIQCKDSPTLFFSHGCNDRSVVMNSEIPNLAHHYPWVPIFLGGRALDWNIWNRGR